MPVDNSVNQLVGLQFGVHASGGVGVTSFKSILLSGGPQQYFRLDETNGTTANDISGNARNGTYGSGITLNQGSLLGSDSNPSVLFDGTTNATVNTSYNPFSGSVTFMGLSRMTDNAANRVLFGDNNNDIVCVQATSTSIILEPNRFGAGTQGTWTSISNIAAGTTYFWVILWNITSSSAELYINGTSQGNQTGLKAVSGTGALQWGNMGSSGLAGAQLGRHDEVATFSSLVSSSFITNLQNAR